jgi:PDGLE domain-containing protein
MKRFTIVALALAIGLATAASPFASTAPDGLNRVADDHGFAAKASGGANYAFPGVSDPRLATGLAGFTGTLIVFSLGFGVVRLVRRP